MKTLFISADKTAIGLSMLCAVHCLLLPLAVVFVPALSAIGIADEHFHQWMLLAVLPSSLFALFMGCRQHHNTQVLLLGLSGLLTLSFGAFVGHELLGEGGEKAATLLGAGIIALAHVRNLTLCRTHNCDCDTH